MTIERISTNSRMSKIVKHNGTAYLCGQVAKDRNADIHTQVTGMLEKVDELLETGFSGREVTLVENLIEELDRIEHDTDTLQIRLRADLFKLEQDLPPVNVMFLYQIIEWIGDVADRAQRVGNRLEQLMAR